MMQQAEILAFAFGVLFSHNKLIGDCCRLGFCLTISVVFSICFRYLECVHPIWHKSHFSRRKLYLVLGFTWFFGLVFILPMYVLTSKVKENRFSNMTLLFSSD